MAAIVANLLNEIVVKSITKSYAAWTLAKACIGWSYVYSTWGDECTPAERKKRFGMKPDHTTIKTSCQVLSGSKSTCSGCKWFPGEERTRCFDCRGFTYWVLKTLFGFKLSGSTVASQWNNSANWCAKGTVAEGIPQNVLVNLFVYKASEKKWTHTGFGYNGESCEASSGVQFFSPMKTKWTHWAIAACFADELNLPEKPKEETPMATGKTLKKGSKGNDVRKLQTLLAERGYDLGKYGIDGDFGKATEAAVKQFQKDRGLKADGIVGDKTWEELKKPYEASLPFEGTVTVHIPNCSLEVAGDLVAKYPGSYTTDD